MFRCLSYPVGGIIRQRDHVEISERNATFQWLYLASRSALLFLFFWFVLLVNDCCQVSENQRRVALVHAIENQVLVRFYFHGPRHVFVDGVIRESDLSKRIKCLGLSLLLPSLLKPADAIKIVISVKAYELHPNRWPIYRRCIFLRIFGARTATIISHQINKLIIII